ncbi:zinc finger CCHC domain-containing 3-like [Paramuricea clavata]|uniref:Zinc finger CCHC domain-containing 3-like n=1 Tax=Paramuricea clavata TaxID=317549 RepID=A0A7D9LFL4_PARCT|nr:zinc finger CCHC domain-containing 3-like [Paramuricea clavata]
MIPFINRTADILLSDHIEAHYVNVREVIDDFRGQFDNFTETFEAIVFMAPGRYRITCKSPRKLEAAENLGLLVRGHPVSFKPISTFKWVNITRLSYGVPDEEITKAMAVYGPIKLIHNEQYSRVYTGVRNILMEVVHDIPMRVRIAGHWCTVHYKGQKRPCFSCGKEGHFSSKCPDKHVQPPPTLPVIPTVAPAGVSEASTSGEVETRHVLNDLLSQVSDGLVNGVTLNQSSLNDALVVVEHPASFASVLSRANDNAPSDVVQSSQDPDIREVIDDEVSAVVQRVVLPESVLPVGDDADVLAGQDQSAELPLESSAVEEPPLAAHDDLPLGDNGSPPPSKLTSKRACPRKSKPRSRSRSPLRDEAPHRLSSSADSSPEEFDNFSFESESVQSPVLSPSMGDDGDGGHSPDNIFASLTASDIWTSPLTQFPPNLPCDPQERIHFPTEPAASQASEESSFILRFFAPSDSPPNGEESS